MSSILHPDFAQIEEDQKDKEKPQRNKLEEDGLWKDSYSKIELLYNRRNKANDKNDYDKANDNGNVSLIEFPLDLNRDNFVSCDQIDDEEVYAMSVDDMSIVTGVTEDEKGKKMKKRKGFGTLKVSKSLRKMGLLGPKDVETNVSTPVEGGTSTRGVPLSEVELLKRELEL